MIIDVLAVAGLFVVIAFVTLNASLLLLFQAIAALYAWQILRGYL